MVPDRGGLAVGLTATGFEAGAAMTVVSLRLLVARDGLTHILRSMTCVGLIFSREERFFPCPVYLHRYVCRRNMQLPVLACSTARRVLRFPACRLQMDEICNSELEQHNRCNFGIVLSAANVDQPLRRVRIASLSRAREYDRTRPFSLTYSVPVPKSSIVAAAATRQSADGCVYICYSRSP